MKKSLIAAFLLIASFEALATRTQRKGPSASLNCLSFKNREGLRNSRLASAEEKNKKKRKSKEKFQVSQAAEVAVVRVHQDS